MFVCKYVTQDKVNLHVNIIIVIAMLSQWWTRIPEKEKGYSGG